jgi:hypothetical protein
MRKSYDTSMAAAAGRISKANDSIRAIFKKGA